jgi:hypothetical protein
VAGLGFSFPSSKRKVTTCPSILFFLFTVNHNTTNYLQPPVALLSLPIQTKRTNQEQEGLVIVTNKNKALEC